MSQFTLKSALTYGFLPVFIALAPVGHSANAAVKSDLKYAKNQPFTVKAGFKEARYGDPVLDWKNPQTTLSFDVPDNNWTDSIEFLISADPQRKPAKTAEILISFNNGPEIPIRTQGKGFDARVTLDKSRLKKRGNKLVLRFKPDNGETCVPRSAGGWILNLEQSTIIIAARERLKDHRLGDIEAYLQNEFTKPQKVAVIADGPNQTKLQALAAQAIGMRMETLPEFSVAQPGDFTVIMGTRDELKNKISRDKLFAEDGPRIFIYKSPKPKLVLTGDTHAHVLALTQAFARHKLPRTRRHSASHGELLMQRPFSSEGEIEYGKTSLSQLGGVHFDPSWGPRPQTINFDIADPKASSGQLLLRVGSNSVVTDNSRLSASLNGQSIGFTRLDKTRKSVAFDLPTHLLRGRDNIITLTPELESEELSQCGFAAQLPELYLGDGSQLTVTAQTPSQPTALSRFSASGGVFARNFGAGSDVILPMGQGRHFETALKTVAKLGQITSTGWSEASFIPSSDFATVNPDNNLLIIAPRRQIHPELRVAAPKIVQSSLRNKNGHGIAAMFPSGAAPGKIQAILTNGPASDFSTMTDLLIGDKIWNALDGSVAYWDNDQVHMAQLVIDLPELEKTKSDQSVQIPGGLEFSILNPRWVALKQSFDNNLPSISSRLSKRIQEEGTTSQSIPVLRSKTTPAPATQINFQPVAGQNSVMTVPELRGFSTTMSPNNNGAASEGIIASSLGALTTVKRKFVQKRTSISQNMSQNGNSNNSDIKQITQYFSPRIIALIAFITALFLILGFARPVSRDR